MTSSQLPPKPHHNADHHAAGTSTPAAAATHPPTPAHTPVSGGAGETNYQQPSGSAQTQLLAKDLIKQYGSTRALAGVSLGVRAGESLAIMGPSGSGKSTLLHVLAGIIQPDSGTVELGQTHKTAPGPVSALSPARRAHLRRETFGFVFQQGLLLPELTAVENVMLAAMLAGHKRAGATELAKHWLANLGLADHAFKPVGQLSGGQAQRVAIARAQVTEPAVTFADEPTGALDSRTSAQVLNTLLGTTVGAGRTLIMVTHDEKVAATCSRTVHINDGRIVSDTAAGGGHHAR